MNIASKAVFPYGYSIPEKADDSGDEEINDLIKRALVVIEPKMRDAIGSECFAVAYLGAMFAIITANRGRSGKWTVKITIAGEFSEKTIENISV